MPDPRGRTRGRRPSVRRDRARIQRAREKQAAQRNAEERRLTPAAYARRRALGWSLVALSVTVLAQHLLSHTGLFTPSPAGSKT